MDSPKRPVDSLRNTSLPLYTACSCSILNIIGFKTETVYNKALTNSESHGETANSLAHLHEMNVHGLYMYL